jgi:signal transduction histidine kinase
LQLSVQLSDGRWFNASIARPPSDPWLSVRLLAPALLLYLLLLGGAVLIAARLTRPLRELTEAADRYCGTGEPVQITPRGPQDLRRAILAFNAMSGRVKQMLEDKDRMLGAIGHDLRTPLACLRVRIESMSPEDQRERAVDKIEEMSDILQDTLELARSQAPGEPTRIVDLAALADTVVEEFRALGHDVESLEAAGRVTAPVKSTLLRRALRNLVENGVKYGGKVEVAARMTDAGAILEVADAGPGIPESQLENVLEPFVRLERSRNRGTGGSGLGLALARSAAHAHQGTLELSNRPEGGLLARIILPRLATSFK